MKKLPAFIIAGVIAASLTTAASAHCMRSGNASAHCAASTDVKSYCADACGRCGYVNRWLDEDNDGICDYHINVCANGGDTCDSDGDGICDFCERDCMYVDENDDGVCDDYQEHKCVTPHHSGRHHHKSHHCSN